MRGTNEIVFREKVPSKKISEKSTFNEIKLKENMPNETKLKKCNSSKSSNRSASGERGVTLVALTVTIILMIILAGIGLKMSSSSNDLIDIEQNRTEGFQKDMNQHIQDIGILSNNVNKATGK